jgi:hypothetical protein
MLSSNFLLHKKNSMKIAIQNEKDKKEAEKEIKLDRVEHKWN